MNELTVTYPTDPPEWTDRDPMNFRCDRCGKMCIDGDGKWAVRNRHGDPARGMPGQFVAVHRVCPGAGGFLRRLIAR